MVTLRQPYREKSPRWLAGGTGSPCSTCCWPWCSAAATFCRRLADDACRTTVFVRQSRRAFQLSGVYQLCADPLSVDLYRGLAAPDALPVGDPCHRRDDAAADRQRGFTRFHLHLNPVVWELVINPDQNEMARDWQLMFISVPVIFLIEMLFATWSWQKLRSLTRRRHYARPVAWFFFCRSSAATWSISGRTPISIARSLCSGRICRSPIR